jgi:uncharacterized circularly permuted ATP-grasp superfamily protein
VLANLDKLVVKPANESGGYGMLIGPHSRQEERESSREAGPQGPAQLHRPAGAHALDRADAGRPPVEPRHVDLRPFILSGERTT